MSFVLAPVDVSNKFREVQIAFYHGKSFLEYESFPITSVDLIVNHKSFDKNRTTLLYIHGYRENLTSDSVQTIVWAFMTRGSYNILVLDWSDYAAGNYITNAIPNLMKVRWAMKFLRTWRKLFRSEKLWENASTFCLLWNTLTWVNCMVIWISLVFFSSPMNFKLVVGHSLGAQMAGYIGRWVIAYSRNTLRLKRISGLDPVGR